MGGLREVVMGPRLSMMVVQGLAFKNFLYLRTIRYKFDLGISVI
jgi:hypothetical protein